MDVKRYMSVECFKGDRDAPGCTEVDAESGRARVRHCDSSARKALRDDDCIG